MINSKCLEIADYDNFSEHKIIQEMMDNTEGVYRYEHPHRKWEYGLAMKFLREVEARTVLNIGGANSPLSTALFNLGMEVTEVDPDAPDERLPNIKYLDKEFPYKGIARYDAIVSTSVIEHVSDHMKFFSDILIHADKAVFLTMDFSPEGKTFSKYHIRTYSDTDMATFRSMATSSKYGYEYQDTSEYDYTSREKNVYDYNFASLALVKKSQ